MKFTKKPRTESRVKHQSFRINIRDFLDEFNEEYDFLYDHYDRVAGYDEAVKAFDDFAADNQKFISEFVVYRGDFISSDREAAAFMFALDSMTIG